MALIDCPECGHQVSNQAAICPSCGVSIATARETAGAGQQITSVQQTSKKLKMHSLVSGGLVVLGLLLVFNGTAEPEASGLGVTSGWLLLVGGLFWLIVTRCRIWWHHD